VVGFFRELSDIARAFQRYYKEKLPIEGFRELAHSGA
jgi:hypothetical protein